MKKILKNIYISQGVLFLVLFQYMKEKGKVFLKLIFKYSIKCYNMILIDGAKMMIG